MTYISSTARLAIYTEGTPSVHLKTAAGVIRYGRNPIVAIVDSTKAGQTVESALGVKSDVPIVGSIQDCLRYQPDVLLLGGASIGGIMPPEWRQGIIQALKAGLDVVNGMHSLLSEDPEIVEIAGQFNCRLWDVRLPPPNLPVGTGKALGVTALTVLTVGTDGAVGKMTTALELTKAAKRAGFSAKFVATGQTGIMIDGAGIAIDRVIGDFMAGATEQLVIDAGFDHDFVFVEGQGSLAHPGWSGVTLGIMHGACPHAMILCHKSTTTKLMGTDFPIPNFNKVIEASETMASFVRQAKVIGVALNTAGLTDVDARKAVEAAEAETGLPSTDPVRFGVDRLFSAIVEYREQYIEKNPSRAN